MKSRVRTSVESIDSSSQGKSELQRKLQTMVAACRDNSLISTGSGGTSGGGKQTGIKDQKVSHTELRLKRAEAQAQINFSKTSPAALPSGPPDSSPLVNRKCVPLDPLQNCYGRPSIAPNNGPKGILTKPSTPKISKGKRVTFNLDLQMEPPSRSDSPSPIPADTPLSPSGTSNNLPNVDNKTQQQLRKTPLFQVVPNATKPTRPSLSEQLNAIANRAGDLTADIKAKAGIIEQSPTGVVEPPLFTSPAKNFTVGNLQCRYPSPAIFFRDRLEYIFHHPFQSTEIQLILYYRDMQSLTLSPNPQPGKIHFRVPRKLVHFASDYDPTKHYVTLYLSSSSALESIRNEILPLIPGRNSSVGTSLVKINST